MSKKQKRISKSTIALVAVLILLTIGVVVNTVIATYTLHATKQQDDKRLAALIIDATEQLSRPIPVDMSGKYYIPAARLILPAPDTSLGEVFYNYSPAGNDIDEEVRLASKNAMRSAQFSLLNASGGTKVIFDAVPKLQSCARGVQITFTPQKGQQADATKLLASGKTAHFYTESLCRNAKLLEFAQQIESY
jgi:hypothetical protein